MPVLALKKLLTGHHCSQIEKSFFFLNPSGGCSFVLLPKWVSLHNICYLQKKLAWEGPIIWILPTSLLSRFFLFRKKLLNNLPVYFLEPDLEGLIQVTDRRHLKIKNTLYPLPPVKVDLVQSYKKNERQLELEKQLFDSTKSFPFYHKGDCIDRLSNPSYLKQLLIKQEKEKSFKNDFYLFIKNLLDK